MNMSSFMNEIVSNEISLEEGLQRLLVIANKTENKHLSEWCVQELNGYTSSADLPDYRKFTSRNIVYSGLNGRFQVTDVPIGPGFLSDETLNSIEKVNLFEGVAAVEKRMSLQENSYRDLTPLASEVYQNTNKGTIGVICTSIRQLIPASFYSSVYSNVKTRIINLLCSYEEARVSLDKLDVTKNQVKALRKKNDDIYKAVVVDGEIFAFASREKKAFWNILVPIITGLIVTVVGGVLVFLISSVWSAQ